MSRLTNVRPPPSENEDAHPPGSSSSDPESPRANALLRVLSESVLDEYASKLQPFQLDTGDVIHAPDQPTDYAYFPTAGVISLLAALEDGSTVEAGVIGSEGLLGTSIVLGADSSPHQGLVQAKGHAFKITSGNLRDLIKSDHNFLSVLLRYTNALFIQVTQTAACNRIHTLEHRLARWLLLTHDRVEGDEFRLTQEFISRMLGVRRAGVSVAANLLRQMQAIDYERGSVRVLSRTSLESASCECYQVVKAEYDRLPISPQ